MKIIITGGAGFIGSAVARYITNNTNNEVLVIDKLTYAGSLLNLGLIDKSSRFKFYECDICDSNSLKKIFHEYEPDAVLHLAAESHVDRSISSAKIFIDTNIVGTFNLLEISKNYWTSLPLDRKDNFRFHHVSTDEVYGDLPHPSESYLQDDLPLFTEKSHYKPSSPYSASKAASDHLVRAWNRTYSLPTLITNCSNNYGPYQYPEKLIPLTILNALDGKNIPVYGKGDQIRDWLYVEDHAEALYLVLTKGKVGETYNIGGFNERSNINVVETICMILDELRPKKEKYSQQIYFVKDRLGHDRRYAIDASKITNEINWRPNENFDTGLKKTIHWYLDNLDWVNQIRGRV